MNTTENNKLLAEFLDLLTFDSEGNIKEDISKYNFDLNWNLLIEVVKKITSIEILKIIGIEIFSDWKDVFNECLITCDKQKVYNACVEFVKWYNQNNN